MNKHSLVLVMTSMILVVACDRVIEEGGLGNIRIGQSKGEVLSQLVNDGVEAVTPEPDESIIIKLQSIDTISRLEKVSCIRLSDSQGVRLDLIFDQDNLLTKIDKSIPARSEYFGIEVNQTKNEVIAQLKKALLQKSNIVLSNCTPNMRWITLKGLSEADIAYLDGYNTWLYHQPDSYTHVVLKFLDGSLVKIKYVWSPIEK